MAGTGARRSRLPVCSGVVGGRFGNRAEFLCLAKPPKQSGNWGGGSIVQAS